MESSSEALGRAPERAGPRPRDTNDAAFVSTAPATRAHRQLAVGAIAVSALVFVVALPFAKTPLAAVPPFIAVYQAALVVCDLVTALLLLGQARYERATPLSLLAAGYLFTAALAVSHTLSFPGLFAGTGLLGASAQSTAWLYMFWHGGFPLFVIAYARLKSPTPPALYGVVFAVIAAAVALTWLATAGAGLLPPIMNGNRYTGAMVFVVSTVWLLSLAALYVLWRAKPHSLLDLWLMVVMFAWLCDIGLAAVFNAGRYDVGFYAGRIYGLLAASFVLGVLLIEHSALHGRLAERSAALAAANRELESFSYSVSHDLRAPLRAIDGYARMLEEDYASRLDTEARRLIGVVRSNVARMHALIEGLLAFSRLARAQPRLQGLDMERLARDVAAELRPDARSTFECSALPAAAGEPMLIRQVWANLIGNAFKYSAKKPAPRIEIGGRSEPHESLYWVRDNGAGFDMQHAGKLFGVFQRLHRADEFEGTGIGLALVQRIVARHGGRVWAEARPDEGACFYFTLPLGPAA
jgi:signal transduction histidine kinase